MEAVDTVKRRWRRLGEQLFIPSSNLRNSTYGWTATLMAPGDGSFRHWTGSMNTNWQTNCTTWLSRLLVCLSYNKWYVPLNCSPTGLHADSGISNPTGPCTALYPSICHGWLSTPCRDGTDYEEWIIHNVTCLVPVLEVIQLKHYISGLTSCGQPCIVWLMCTFKATTSRVHNI